MKIVQNSLAILALLANVSAAELDDINETFEGIGYDSSLAEQIQMQSAADEAKFSKLAKVEKLRSKLLLLEKYEYDSRSVMKAFNMGY